jgi:lipopolysaccharide export system protein LptC
MYSAHTLVNHAGLEARFARAARHSRLVRFLRISIPTLVVAAMTGVVLLSLFNPFRVVANITADTDNLVVSGTKITMESPHMHGYSQDLRPYEVWGNTAVQDTTDPDNVDLTEPRGKMLMEDGSTTNVESRTGKFNNKAQMLDLYKEVYVQTSTGYEVRLNHAQVDLAAGAVASDDGVNVKFDGGKVKADKLRLTNRGELVIFEGHVVMDLDQTGPIATAPQPAPEAVAAPLPVVADPPRSAGKPRSLTGNSFTAR